MREWTHTAREMIVEKKWVLKVLKVEVEWGEEEKREKLQMRNGKSEEIK